MTGLGDLLGPAVVAAIERLVDERVEARLADLGAPTGNGHRGLVTLAVAADMLGMSYDAVRKAAHRGTLPTVRVGRRVLVDLDRLDRP